MKLLGQQAQDLYRVIGVVLLYRLSAHDREIIALPSTAGGVELSLAVSPPAETAVTFLVIRGRE